MALQPYELDKFQGAAIEMCYRLNEDPYQPLDAMRGDSPPQWFVYAKRMAEHSIMVEKMRNFGHVF